MPSPAAFLERLLERTNPHAVDSPTRLQAQLLGGRWLTLRRLHAGVCLETLALRSGIASDTLVLLEAGVASRDMATHSAWLALAHVLSDAYREPSKVALALSLALGRLPEDPLSVSGLITDLRRFS